LSTFLWISQWQPRRNRVSVFSRGRNKWVLRRALTRLSRIPMCSLSVKH
jgi:hypothetical protein